MGNSPDKVRHMVCRTLCWVRAIWLHLTIIMVAVVALSIPMARTVGGIITAVFSLVNPEYV